MAQSEEKKAGEKPAKKPKTHEQLFKEGWILALMKNMEEQLDEWTRTKLMEYREAARHILQLLPRLGTRDVRDGGSEAG